MMRTGLIEDKKTEDWLENAWNSYAPQIYNLCRMKCYSREDALDVFQNVALRFCQNARKITYQDSIYPWLLRVFKNCFYDYVRIRQKTAPFSMVSDVVGDYRALPVERSVFYKEGNQKNDELKRAVESLSARDRNLIDMTFQKGLTTEELSALYGVSFSAVVKRRHSAIKRAREALLG